MRKSIKLTSAAVEGIQLQGGTILGTSRGGADIAKIVQSISRQAIDMVFVVGGNGGNAAAAAIHEGKTKVGVFSPSSSSFSKK
jgi:6-phosphofructokinase 1